MQRLFSLVLVLLLLFTPFAQANSWEWWAPNTGWNQPQLPGWADPLPPVEPKPQPDPNPVPPPTNPGGNGGPLQPVQPGKPGNKLPYPSSALTADEQSLINQVNQERIKNGMQPLQTDSRLVALAKEKSYDMAVNNYFDHVSPNLGTVYTMLDRAGVSYSRAGENIARTGSVARAHPLFMGSQGHRANILHSGYTHIGVGIVKQGTSYHVTQIFIRR